VGLHAPSRRQLALGYQVPNPRAWLQPQTADTWHWNCKDLGARARPARLGSFN